MTVLCGGGPSGPRPGFSITQYVGPAALGALLNNIPVVWAVPLAALIGVLTYDLSTFCTSDPPALPTLTADDAIDLLNPADLEKFSNAVNHWRDFIGNYLWPTFCHCTTTTTPAPPTPPAQPPNWPDFNNPSIAPCWNQTLTYTVPNAGVGYRWQLFGTETPDGFGAYLPSPPPTSITLTLKVNSDGAHNGNYSYIFVGRQTPNGANIQSIPYGPFAPGTTNIETVTLDSRSLFVELETISASNPQDNSTTVTVVWNCNNNNPITQIPCCPQDPLVQTLLASVAQTLTLIQRQLIPFAYISGTVHSGLSGAGSFTVSSIIGIQVHVTTMPASIGQEIGTPTFYFDVGWVSILTGDGVIEERRIQAIDSVWTPRSMSEATVVGYSFHAGVVVNITELEREP